MWIATAHTRNFELEAYGHTEEQARRALVRMWDDWRENTGATLTTEELIGDAYIREIEVGQGYFDGSKYTLDSDLQTKTCEGCGGEIIPENITLDVAPENGLCAKELPECADQELEGALALIDWGVQLSQDYLESILDEKFPDLSNDDWWEMATASHEKALELVATLTGDSKRVVDLESQLGIAFEIMTDKQIADNQHLFQEHIDIEDSVSTNQTEGEN